MLPRFYGLKDTLPRKDLLAPDMVDFYLFLQCVRLRFNLSHAHAKTVRVRSSGIACLPGEVLASPTVLAVPGLGP